MQTTIILTLMLCLGFVAKIAHDKPEPLPTVQLTAEGAVLVYPPKDKRLVGGF